MQNKAKSHTTRLTAAYFRSMGIPVLPWHSKSLDMNPIEHFGANLRGDRPHQLTSFQQLHHVLMEEWDAIPREV